MACSAVEHHLLSVAPALQLAQVVSPAAPLLPAKATAPGVQSQAAARATHRPAVDSVLLEAHVAMASAAPQVSAAVSGGGVVSPVPTAGPVARGPSALARQQQSVCRVRSALQLWALDLMPTSHSPLLPLALSPQVPSQRRGLQRQLPTPLLSQLRLLQQLQQLQPHLLLRCPLHPHLLRCLL